MLRANNTRLSVTPARRFSGVTTNLGAGLMAAYANQYNPGASRSVFGSPDLIQPFGARPEGYTHPEAWVLPQKNGSLKVYPSAEIVLTASADLNIGRPLAGNVDISITSSADLSMIIALSGNSDLSLTSSGALDTISNMDGNSTLSITSSASLDALVAISGSCTLSITASANQTGVTDLQAETAEPGLTVDSIAAAVWNAVAADFNTAGTMGEKVNDAGSAANPWTEVLEGTYTAAEIMRMVASVLGGKVSKVGDVYTFRNIQDSANRVTATTTAEGERTSITLNL